LIGDQATTNGLNPPAAGFAAKADEASGQQADHDTAIENDQGAQRQIEWTHPPEARNEEEGEEGEENGVEDTPKGAVTKAREGNSTSGTVLWSGQRG
jgi:hypothetical protein